MRGLYLLVIENAIESIGVCACQPIRLTSAKVAFAFVIIYTMDGPQIRKRKRLTISEKLQICELVHEKTPYAEISAKYGIGRSTITGIVSKEN